MVNVGIIGKAGHAARIIDILRRNQDVRLKAVYYPRPVVDVDLPLTQDIDEVLGTDAVIIASPTYTHSQYLEILADYNGYVLVEKPAVSTEKESERLSRLSVDKKKRIQVNYSLQQSDLTRMLKEILETRRIGIPILFTVSTCQGLAFKQGYDQSWRGDIERSFGVMELVGSHFVRLAIFLFGAIANSKSVCRWMASQKTASPDSVLTELEMVDGPTVHLFHSYAGPLHNRLTLLGTDGYWDYDGTVARLHYPRDTFSESGRYIDPPLQSEVRLPFSEMWSDGLQRSVNGFIDVVKCNGECSVQDFEAGLDAMIPVFKARKMLADAGTVQSVS